MSPIPISRVLYGKISKLLTARFGVSINDYRSKFSQKLNTAQALEADIQSRFIIRRFFDAWRQGHAQMRLENRAPLPSAPPPYPTGRTWSHEFPAFRSGWKSDTFLADQQEYKELFDFIATMEKKYRMQFPDQSRCWFFCFHVRQHLLKKFRSH